MVTSQKCGATQECLMKIFRTYIRSKIDYGSIIYASASKTTLSRIDVVSNEALRIATGTFKSTPIEALYNVAEETTPSGRRDYLTIRYYLKVRASISNPAYKCIAPKNENLYNNQTGSNFAIRMKRPKATLMSGFWPLKSFVPFTLLSVLERSISLSIAF